MVLFTKFSLDSILFFSSNWVFRRDSQIQHSKTQLFVIVPCSTVALVLRFGGGSTCPKTTCQSWHRLVSAYSHPRCSYSPLIVPISQNREPVSRASGDLMGIRNVACPETESQSLLWRDKNFIFEKSFWEEWLLLLVLELEMKKMWRGPRN